MKDLAKKSNNILIAYSKTIKIIGSSTVLFYLHLKSIFIKIKRRHISMPSFTLLENISMDLLTGYEESEEWFEKYLKN